MKLKINELIKKSQYDYYIFTKFINKNNSFYETKLDWHNLKDNESQDICVNVPNNSVIMEKYGYGLSKEHINHIKQIGCIEVDICGLQTDACVYAIAFQLFDNEIYPNILINYTATAPNREKQAREMLIHQFGKVDKKL